MNGANRKILVIDDNHSIHEDFRKILCAAENGDALADQEAELFGEPVTRGPMARFQIDSAMQGHEGLERVKRAVAAGEPYAMAFVDVRMPPGWDGIETTARIWEVYPDLQVVICTAYADYSWGDMIARVGQSDRLVILKKPFDNVEVLQLANALTAKWDLLQQVKGKIDSLEHVIVERTGALHETEKHSRELVETMLKAEEERTRMEVRLRFVRDAFAGLMPVLQWQAEVLEAAKVGNVNTELISRIESAINTADLEYLRAKIPHAIERLLEDVEQMGKIIRAMREFSYPGASEKNLNTNHRSSQ